jgi:IS30 family transposase
VPTSKFRGYRVGGFFAHPHSLWERGSNEYLNRIVREFFSEGVPITSDPARLAMVAAEINDRPRKIFDWMKPSEIFAELVEEDTSTG